MMTALSGSIHLRGEKYVKTRSMNLGYDDSSGDLTSWDKSYVWHPFTFLPEWLDEGNEIPIIVDGDGPYLIDHDGRRLIDGNSSIWCNVHGHSHPLINEAIQEQVARFAHTSFLGYAHPPGILLSRKLIEDYLGKWGYQWVFFSESGSNAVEVALRMVLQWQHLDGQAQRKRIVAFRRSYHGDSLGSASATGLTTFRLFIGDAGYEVIHVERPEDLWNLEKSSEVAALITEPIVAGAAGMIPWPAGFQEKCRQWCDETGALLIHDEVMSGFGRTGKMFGFEHEGVAGDILILGKGLSGGVSPLSATITNHRVFERFASVTKREDSLLYGHSYSGHAIGCAAALASLEIFEKENVLERLKPSIEELALRLEEISTMPEVITTHRTGFVTSIEVRDSDQSQNQNYGATMGRRVAEDCWNRGLATRAIGNYVILVLPLCASPALVKESIDIIREAIIAVYGTSM